MSKIRIKGDTSGYVDLETSATGSNLSVTGNAVHIPGHVIQVVQHKFDTDHRNATSSNSYVATQITGSITPKYSNSNILVQVFTSGNNNNSSAHELRATIYRDSPNGTNLFSQDNYVMVGTQSSPSRIHVPLSMAALDSPNTTSAVTYTVYFKCTSSSSVEIPAHTNSASVLILQEIAV